MKREIRCRLFIPTESGFSEFKYSSPEKQGEFADECIRRMGESLNNAESVYELLRAASAVPR